MYVRVRFVFKSVATDDIVLLLNSDKTTMN